MVPDKFERISVIVATKMNTDEGDLQLPLDLPVQAIIARLISAPELPFRSQGDGGAPIPYRLMWREGHRILSESETLREASVEEGHTLVMSREARAGA